MYEGLDLWSFLLGLPLGLVIGAVVLYINRRVGKKARKFDERYQRIHQRGKSLSWSYTSSAILIAWTIIILVEGPSLAFFLLTAIWVIHMLSYLIATRLIERNH